MFFHDVELSLVRYYARAWIVTSDRLAPNHARLSALPLPGAGAGVSTLTFGWAVASLQPGLVWMSHFSELKEWCMEWSINPAMYKSKVLSSYILCISNTEYDEP